VDTAVTLVRAYLHVNGYFTVVEYPVLEARKGGAREVTALDVLAVRFPGAGHEVLPGRGRKAPVVRSFRPDPVLQCPTDRPDMIVGEVKEGPARFNAATLSAAVLEVALARFGCCPPEHAAQLARRLLAKGRVDVEGGHTVRMVAFGAVEDAPPSKQWTTIPMGHVTTFLRRYLREHWDVVRHTQVKDPALGVLALLEKWGSS